jgi:hypothetical protein
MIVPPQSKTTLSVASEGQSPSPPTYEEALQTSYTRLKGEISAYNATEDHTSGSDDTLTRNSEDKEAQHIASAMQAIGDTHPDPQQRVEWRQRAQQFRQAKKEKRKEILRRVGKVVDCVLGMPCAIVGTSLRITGGALHLAGSVIGGAGDAVFGPVDSKKKGTSGGSSSCRTCE